MHNSVHSDLLHRGESLVEYPDAGFWTTLGGNDGVVALIKDLYRRIEHDDLPCEAFPHFDLNRLRMDRGGIPFGNDGDMMTLTVALIPSHSGEDDAMKWFCPLVMSSCAGRGRR